jgi:large subunit ribosomal protein L3
VTVLGMIGKKIGMTQAFDDQERLMPVTVLEMAPCPVVQVKDQASDGYTAIKVGFKETKATRLTRAKQGVFKKAGVASHKGLKEFRLDDVSGYSVGQLIGVGMFEVGEIVDVTGRSKGLGFQGAVRRHNFSGGPKTHGQSDRHRAPGSVGASSSPSRVFKGTRMAGHMGDDQVTVKGLTIVRVDAERNLLLVKGAVPGGQGEMVVIEKRR